MQIRTNFQNTGNTVIILNWKKESKKVKKKE